MTPGGREDEVLAAVQAGAIGFLSKSLSPNSFIRALRNFHTTGARPMSRIMAGRVLRLLRSMPSTASMIPAPEVGTTATDKSLTNRAEQVLEWIARGARHRDIASELYVSESTVKKHVKSTLQKLGGRNQAQAAAGWQVRRSKAQRRTGSVSTARPAADHL